MLRIEPSGGPAADLGSIAMLTQQSNFRPSILYNVLPTIVSSRIPKISSLRRSFSHKRHGRFGSLTELSPADLPPHYTSRPGSGTSTPNRASAEVDSDFSDDASDRPGSSAELTPPLFPMYEMKSGINWKYARSGISLMTQAYRESTASLQNIDESCTSLIRQLYIHGMTYLLRGLPADLTPEENFSLQAALPHGIADVQTDASQYALVPISQRTAISAEATPEPTVLHRITATVVFQMFIFMQFLLPYVKLLLSNTYQLERKHQIAKRLVNTSVTTVDELGRRSLRLSQTVCQMNDGKVGQAINDLTIWWVKSVTGGVQQGLEEGLSTMRTPVEGPRGRVTAEQ